MTFIFLLKDNTGLFSSQSLDFSNQYNNVTKSSEHSLDPSFGDTVLNIMLSFSNYCILLACGILMYQMPIRFIYNIQIKVTLHILHILQNKKGKYQNTIQEQSCAKVILSTVRKPQDKILSLLKYIKFFFRCVLFPFQVQLVGVYLLQIIYYKWLQLFFYMSPWKNMFLTHIACSCDNTFCSCDSS